jgi:alpha-glucosidase
VHFSLPQFASIALMIGLTGSLAAQTSAATPSKTSKPSAAVAQPAPPKAVENPTDPVADPKAVVTLGSARFTVLTPEMIRMEWAADGKFENHASFVFLNRRLPPSKPAP